MKTKTQDVEAFGVVLLLLNLLLCTTVTSFGFHPLATRWVAATTRTFSNVNSAAPTDTVHQHQQQQQQQQQQHPDVPKTGGRGVTSPADRVNPLLLGAPIAKRPKGGRLITKGGIQVLATVTPVLDVEDALHALTDHLDSQRGVLLSSTYEVPGRYSRWSLGFVNPPICLEGRSNEVIITALNQRGQLVLLPAIHRAMLDLKQAGTLSSVHIMEDATIIKATISPPPPVGTFSEEQRSRQPSVFSVVRALVELFTPLLDDTTSTNNMNTIDGGQLGLYGAFGYDLTFQFEPIEIKQTRDPIQRDLVLYLPDEILVHDKQRNDAWTITYEFESSKTSGTATTLGMERIGSIEPFQPYNNDETNKNAPVFEERDTPKFEFATSVERAKREFAVGNLFEAVLSQTFRRKCGVKQKPSMLFKRLKTRNPSPYGFLINLGKQEYLVGASPEMFVRCERTNNEDNPFVPPNSLRVETCPISGTVARGADALEDAKRIKSLLANAKEESELTMCTDVDRNDKSRICIPGTVRVIGRRQIEMYSRLIHTVDHVEGYLRPEFDSLDAFLCHTWAVTVTGAPKTWAIQFVEDMERSPRCWYGGAVGHVGFDGGLNTGLTLRTVRIYNGIAEVRAGATLLYDSSPPAEEAETELKASAIIDALVRDDDEDDEVETIQASDPLHNVGIGKRIVLIDHEDSFVHTLGNYLRQTGAEVETLRSGPFALAAIERMVTQGEKPDMLILSPGPGNPSDFGLSQTIEVATKHSIPIFGVCLGLQGIVEHFGGTLGILGYPMHGKPSMITLTAAGQAERSIFTGLPDTFEVARYHSLHGLRDKMPSCLEITAMSDDGIVMAIQHKELPMAAVQFHPESILTSPVHGIGILRNALQFLQQN